MQKNDWTEDFVNILFECYSGDLKTEDDIKQNAIKLKKRLNKLQSKWKLDFSVGLEKLNENYERKKTFLVGENYIMWGFRYALGRRTGVVDDVVETIKRVWLDLEPTTQRQIKQEIQTAIDQNRAGMQCDVDSWREILNLEIENEK